MATIKYKDENNQWQEIAIDGGSSVEVIDDLESESTTAALSANQGKVLNEGKQDVLVSGTNIKTINGESILGSGDIETVEVVDNLNSTDTTAALSANQGRVIADELAGKQDLLMDGINIKTINGENITGRGNITIEGGGGTVEVDMEMSDTSENAVANKVIKEYVDGFIPSQFTNEFNNDFTI